MDKTDWLIISVGVAIVGGILLLALVGVSVTRYYEAPAWVAQSNEVRSAVAQLGCSASEDVLGKATDVNQTVAEYRVWNRRPLVAWYWPNAIAEYEPIEIPACDPVAREGDVERPAR